MNIAIFTDTYFPDINGVASSVYTLSTELRKRGHNVYVFTVSEPRSARKKMEEESSVYRFPSIPIIFLKPKRAASPFSIRLMRLIKKFKIDIIHTQTEFFMGYMAKGASTSYRLPIVHTFHTMYEDYLHYIANGKLITPAMARRYSRTFCQFASAVIAPTEKTADFLRRCEVSRPIYVIPTGINLEPFSRDSHPKEACLVLKKKLNLDPSWPIILCLGRIAQEKSLDMAISAMPGILKRVPEARMLVVGTGPDKENLEDLSRSLGIADHVIFTGAVPYLEIGSYYQLGDVFLCCSTTETQGLTYYEAMAAGIPIVARKDECIRKILRERVDGRLFEDPASLPDIMYDILTDRETSQMYARNAFDAVIPYSAATFGERVEDVYMNVIAQRRVRHAQRVESIVTVPRALRHLRLVTAHPTRHKKREQKNARANRS